jgi:hypothetical protein
MPHRVRDTKASSLPGLTRQSILFERLLRRWMDTRVKPAYDDSGTGSARRRYARDILPEPAAMKTLAIFVAIAAFAASTPADAKGCLKGAVVGGVAGHYAGHHTVLGAIAGCAYGRHRANEQDRTRQGQRPPPAGEKL